MSINSSGISVAHTIASYYYLLLAVAYQLSPSSHKKLYSDIFYWEFRASNSYRWYNMPNYFVVTRNFVHVSQRSTCECTATVRYDGRTTNIVQLEFIWWNDKMMSRRENQPSNKWNRIMTKCTVYRGEYYGTTMTTTLEAAASSVWSLNGLWAKIPRTSKTIPKAVCFGPISISRQQHIYTLLTTHILHSQWADARRTPFVPFRAQAHGPIGDTRVARVWRNSLTLFDKIYIMHVINFYFGIEAIFRCFTVLFFPKIIFFLSRAMFLLFGLDCVVRHRCCLWLPSTW